MTLCCKIVELPLLLRKGALTFGIPQVREFLQKKQREREAAAAVQVQKVYRGHLGRNLGRTEKNKLKAQYNMGWLATYITQLEKVADIEHWDLYRGDVVEIAHRYGHVYMTVLQFVCIPSSPRLHHLSG